VAGFRETLEAIAQRVPELRMLVIMGTDGIPVDRYVVRPDPNMEAVAAEYTTLLRSSLQTAADTGLGDLHEVTIVNERLTAVLVAITREYYLFAALGPGANVGQSRYVMRLAGLALEKEFA
jgi:predicted regulator of Ras-like GTPase activity (Roadblock/LC7/MglB family)